MHWTSFRHPIRFNISYNYTQVIVAVGVLFDIQWIGKSHFMDSFTPSKNTPLRLFIGFLSNTQKESKASTLIYTRLSVYYRGNRIMPSTQYLAQASQNHPVPPFPIHGWMEVFGWFLEVYATLCATGVGSHVKLVYSQVSCSFMFIDSTPRHGRRLRTQMDNLQDFGATDVQRPGSRCYLDREVVGQSKLETSIPRSTQAVSRHLRY